MLPHAMAIFKEQIKGYPLEGSGRCHIFGLRACEVVGPAATAVLSKKKKKQQPLHVVRWEHPRNFVFFLLFSVCVFRFYLFFIFGFCLDFCNVPLREAHLCITKQEKYNMYFPKGENTTMLIQRGRIISCPSTRSTNVIPRKEKNTCVLLKKSEKAQLCLRVLLFGFVLFRFSFHFCFHIFCVKKVR